MISSHGQTDTGRRRSLNEDAILARDNLFVVCDGMGGRKAGEVASQLALDVIAAFVKRKHNLLIGERTAEEVKIGIGSALPPKELLTMEVRGRDLVSGLPKNIVLNSREVAEAIQDPLAQIVGAVRGVLEQTPPELAADIAEKGMVLTGGGALLRDIDRLLMEETGLPVIIAEAPLTSVVRGSGMALERIERLGSIFTND